MRYMVEVRKHLLSSLRAYDAVALGAPIGGGGRYDDLLGRFGRPQPAVGFALGVDRLHMALAGEERGTGALLAREMSA